MITLILTDENSMYLENNMHINNYGPWNLQRRWSTFQIKQP